MPMTHALEGIRDAFAGASLSAISDDLMQELLVGSTYGAIGFGLFRILEGYIRRTGAYELSEA
jgi:hypothetical protein